MADELQGVACSGSWWSSSARCGDSIDAPLASCSTSVSGDFGGVFGWSPADSEVGAEGNLGCFGNSPASCITFQEAQTLQLSDNMGSRAAMDASPKIAVSGFSSSSVDHWPQSFLSTESPGLYPSKDVSDELFADPSSSATAMNDIQLLYSFGPPLPGAEARHSCPTQFPEMFKAAQPWNFLSNNNTTLDVNGNSSYCSLQDMQYMRSSGNKFNSEHTNSSYKPVLKKARTETPSPLPIFKVRKEKLGDRITALQQLVSPFGKTDTASVLYEAIEYIKFLHEQVKTLSSPYFRNGSKLNMERGQGGQSRTPELRSRGLCLVPISSTFAVACSEIPAIDFWAPPAFDLNYM